MIAIWIAIGVVAALGLATVYASHAAREILLSGT